MRKFRRFNRAFDEDSVVLGYGDVSGVNRIPTFRDNVVCTS